MPPRFPVLVSLFLLFLSNSAWIAPAKAASFAVSPTRFEFSLNKRFTNFFTVTNSSTETVRLRISAAFADYDENDRMIDAAGHPHDLSRWVVINPRRVTLRPSRRRVVRFSVRPPPGLAAGEYRAVIYFQELPSPDDPEPKAEVNEQKFGFHIKFITKLGVTIYGTLGETESRASLEDASLVQNEKEIRISGMLRNEGNAHIWIDLEAKLIGAGEEVLDSGSSRRIVQRDQRRKFTIAMPRPSPGKYRVQLSGSRDGETLFESVLPLQVDSTGKD